MSRFEVTELEGHLTPVTGGTAPGGLSVHVIDTVWNRRLVATFRSEQFVRGHSRTAARASDRAAADAYARNLAA